MNGEGSVLCVTHPKSFGDATPGHRGMTSNQPRHGLLRCGSVAVLGNGNPRNLRSVWTFLRPGVRDQPTRNLPELRTPCHPQAQYVWADPLVPLICNRK